MTEQIKVGDTLYSFDENRREYARPDKSKGELYGKIIYAAHFKGEVIAGETARSWLVGENRFRGPIKVSKSDLRSAGGARWYTERGKADNIFEHEHRYRIVSCVHAATADELRQIAKIVGYKLP